MENGKNEIFSIAVADRFLCAIKQILDERLCPDEYFCRQSADIFYLALANNSASQVEARINDLCADIQKKAHELLEEYPVSVCCGVVFTDSPPESFSVSSQIGFMLTALGQAKNEQQKISVFMMNSCMS